MPKVRDGNNRVSEFRVEPIGSPPGPVIRDRVSEARMADFEAERARAAAPQRSTPPWPPAELRVGGKTGHWARKRAERLPRIVDAIRGTVSLNEAADLVGMSADALKGLVQQYRKDGTLPGDVDELIRSRATNAGRPRRTEAPRERPTADRPADPDVDVAAGGASPAPAEVGASAAAEAPHVEAQAPEALDPATVEAPGGAPDPAPSEVATPPEPQPDMAAIAKGYAALGSLALAPLVLEGEDRCEFGTFVGQVTVLVCDRPKGHDERHRGRLIRVGIVSDTIAFLGHAAVSA